MPVFGIAIRREAPPQASVFRFGIGGSESCYKAAMSGIEHYDGEAVEKGSSPKIYLVNLQRRLTAIPELL